MTSSPTAHIDGNLATIAVRACSRLRSQDASHALVGEVVPSLGAGTDRVVLHMDHEHTDHGRMDPGHMGPGHMDPEHMDHDALRMGHGARMGHLAGSHALRRKVAYHLPGLDSLVHQAGVHTLEEVVAERPPHMDPSQALLQGEEVSHQVCSDLVAEDRNAQAVVEAPAHKDRDDHNQHILHQEVLASRRQSQAQDGLEAGSLHVQRHKGQDVRSLQVARHTLQVDIHHLHEEEGVHHMHVLTAAYVDEDLPQRRLQDASVHPGLGAHSRLRSD